MLEHTFVHVPGVGELAERSLWTQGCRTWDHYLADPDNFSVGGASRDVARLVVKMSAEALRQKSGSFFADQLPVREYWRALPHFKHSTVYLDIETDGRNTPDAITIVGLYDGDRFTALVKGQDLENFPEIIAKYDMVVTFFGSGFDIPMLKRAFPRAKFPGMHVDLCTVLKRLGFRGGLKKIEKQLGLSRSSETDGLNGLDAIRLWREYRAGRDRSLEILIEYNKEDVVNLLHLADVAYSRHRGSLLTEAGLTEL